jgi:hypothetical protein
MDPATAAFLNFDRRSTGIFDRDGNEITNGDSIWLSLQKLSMTDPKAAGIYLNFKQAAEAEERKLRLESGMAAMQHIERYMAKFLEAESLGFSLPNVLPDPRDIVFDSAGNVHIVGPVTHDQLARVNALLDLRDLNLKVIRELSSIQHLSDSQRHDIWLTCRRRIYWINRQIPPRLRERVPPFREN